MRAAVTGSFRFMIAGRICPGISLQYYSRRLPRSRTSLGTDVSIYVKVLYVVYMEGGVRVRASSVLDRLHLEKRDTTPLPIASQARRRYSLNASGERVEKGVLAVAASGQQNKKNH